MRDLKQEGTLPRRLVKLNEDWGVSGMGALPLLGRINVSECTKQ